MCSGDIARGPHPGREMVTENVRSFVRGTPRKKRSVQELRLLSQKLIRARDQEWRQIARELHESAGQSSAALKMTLVRLGEALPKSRDLANDLLASAVELINGAIREVRTVSYPMHPPLLDEAGLGPALRWYAKGYSERSGITLDVQIPEDLGCAAQVVETTLFRLVQEALTNIHLYSGSRTGAIRLAREDAYLHAEIRDGGCGLSAPKLAGTAAASMGVGIAGMRERVAQLGGIFELESEPGRGTTVRATLPISQVREGASGKETTL